MRLDEFSDFPSTAEIDSTERVRWISFGFDIASEAPPVEIVYELTIGMTFVPRLKLISIMQPTYSLSTKLRPRYNLTSEKVN